MMKIRYCSLAAKIVIIFNINITSHQPQIKSIHLGHKQRLCIALWAFFPGFLQKNNKIQSISCLVFFSSVTRLDDADSLSMRSVFHSSRINHWRALAISNWWIALHGSLVLALPHPLISFSPSSTSDQSLFLLKLKCNWSEFPGCNTIDLGLISWIFIK